MFLKSENRHFSFSWFCAFGVIGRGDTRLRAVIPYCSYWFGFLVARLGNKRAEGWQVGVIRAKNGVSARSPKISFRNLYGP